MLKSFIGSHLKVLEFLVFYLIYLSIFRSAKYTYICILIFSIILIYQESCLIYFEFLDTNIISFICLCKKKFLAPPQMIMVDCSK